MLSFFIVAIVFGVISPKIKIRRVRIPVARPTKVLVFFPRPACDARLIANVVVREEAERFTMLLPINMALNIFSGFSIRASTLAAFLLPDLQGHASGVYLP